MYDVYQNFGLVDKVTTTTKHNVATYILTFKHHVVDDVSLENFEEEEEKEKTLSS